MPGSVLKPCSVAQKSLLWSKSAVNAGSSVAASHGERTRGLVVPRRRRAVVLSES
jgi:hypothetical protein